MRTHRRVQELGRAAGGAQRMAVEDYASEIRAMGYAQILEVVQFISQIKIARRAGFIYPLRPVLALSRFCKHTGRDRLCDGSLVGELCGHRGSTYTV